MDRDKIYFLPGDVVMVRQDLPNKPKMIIVKRVVRYIKNSPNFQGMLCRWFSTDHKLQEGVFNTKDLIKL